ncbi:MAG: hypothetical protein JF614_04370 [Acidobacteria bacterium]|nr:hypothetical protein [Acidobacteriota bacterium]
MDSTPNPAPAPEASELSGGVILARGLKLAGETVAPGASLLLDGEVASGVAHLVVGTLARMAFGPVGVLLVAADSYSKSVSGKSLLEQFQSAVK